MPGDLELGRSLQVGAQAAQFPAPTPNHGRLRGPVAQLSYPPGAFIIRQDAPLGVGASVPAKGLFIWAFVSKPRFDLHGCPSHLCRNTVSPRSGSTGLLPSQQRNDSKANWSAPFVGSCCLVTALSPVPKAGAMSQSSQQSRGCDG